MSSPDIPENAPEHCPGTQSEDAGKAGPCAGCPNQSACASGAGRQEDPDLGDMAHRLSGIKHIILVLSGKGGVGKSSVSAALARQLARTNHVGLLDVDICGPSQVRIMGADGLPVHNSSSGWAPVQIDENLCVMSIGFLLGASDDAVIWRGPKKNGLIKQFLLSVDWGELDYLVVDTPPGTSDEHISLVQYLTGAAADRLTGAILITTPQEVSLLDVRKEVNFCRKTNVRILGVVENCAYFQCPCCDEKTQMYPSSTGGAKGLCEAMKVPLLVQLPFDPKFAEATDIGHDYVKENEGKPTATALGLLTDRVVAIASATSD